MRSTKHLAIVPLMIMALLGAGCSSSPASQPSNSQSNTGDASQPSQPIAGNTTGSGKSLDASNCNPGTSIDPIDKGKSFSSTDMKYTLLDARVDDLNASPALAPYINYKKVLLVKLQVENISQNDKLNLSSAEVDLANAPPQDDRTKMQQSKYQIDLVYSRDKACVSLAEDVSVGTFPAGKKVVGYYIFALPDDKPYTNGLYFDGRYFSADDVGAGKSFKVAGSFKLK